MSNVRSVFPKIDELRLSISCLNVDIIVITESWLNDNISDDLLHMNDFDLFRYDRIKRKGGGVCIWAKSLFQSKRLMPVSAVPSFIEIIFLRVFCMTFSIVCVGMYVPPGLCKADHATVTDFLMHEIDHILTIFPSDRLVVSGDLNDFRTDFLFEHFCLENRVTQPTRQNAFLDQIWIDESLCDLYPNPATIGPPIRSSDHSCVILRSLCPVPSSE